MRELRRAGRAASTPPEVKVMCGRVLREMAKFEQWCEPLFDIERLTETALQVLADPAEFAPLGRAARQTIEENYSLDTCIPPLGAFLEGVANDKRR